jgi:hypothetical protein
MYEHSVVEKNNKRRRSNIQQTVAILLFWRGTGEIAEKPVHICSIWSQCCGKMQVSPFFFLYLQPIKR